jgi:hypothetical protein
VPRRANGAEIHEVDGQILLTKGPNGAPHRLNPTGALLWRCFDGSASLATIAEDLAAVVDLPVATLQDDVVALARELGASGLLARVDAGVPARSELDLIISCCRAGLAEIVGSGPREVVVDPRVDWAVVERLARGHRLCGQVQSVLAPPDEVARRLEADLVANAAHTRLLSRHLGDVVENLSDAHIRALPFKGPVLARTIFGAVDARQYRDLDVLVARRDFARAVRVLGSHRYRPRPRPEAGRHEAAGVRSRPMRAHEIDLTHDTEPVVVDLHRGLAPRIFRAGLPFDAMWERRISVDLAGRSVPGLCAEDSLTVLGIQVAKDAWERRLVLSKLVDVAWSVAGQPELDLDLVMARARARGCAGLVRFSLALATEVLGPLPGPALALPDPPLPLAVRVTEARRDLVVGGSPRGGLRRARFHGDLRERRRDQVGPFVRWYVVPTDDDLARIHLPERLHPLHYLLRPLHLTVEAARSRQVKCS